MTACGGCDFGSDPGGGMAGEVLKAPFPYPGGKSKVADLVWSRLGDVANYCEPFAGSLAVLLRRPAEHFTSGYRVETVNDTNSYLVNFWRCLEKGLAEEVARHADWPVMEADLHARHRWLTRSDESYAWKLLFAEDPHFCDPKIAGWWVWGQCCWIGSGWCGEAVSGVQARPIIGGFENQLGRGVHGGQGLSVQVPDLTSGGCGDATPAKMPELASGMGRGVAASHGRPQLADAFDIGRGVNSGGSVNWQQMPRLGERNSVGYGVHAVGPTVGTCDNRREWLVDWMTRLGDRLRLVRTCYGHWNRICDSDSTLVRLGTTGVFLDPPYPLKQKVSGKKSRASGLYATDGGNDLDALRDEVLDWCKRWGVNPAVRAAVCCYEGDGYEPLAELGWDIVSWEANGGYGNQGGGGKADNAKRERIYFSPACVVAPSLF